MEESYTSYQFTGLNSPSFSEGPEIEFSDLIEKDGKKHYQCTYDNCGKIFKFKSEIMRHRVIHFNNRPYTCPIDGCKKSFKRPDALENHIRIHTKEMPFECEIPGCNQSFTTKSGLRYHLLKHKERKSFECNFPECGKSFLTQAQLKQHEKATNFHQRLSNRKTTEETVIMPKCELKQEDSSYNEFFTPTPRPAVRVEWQVKSQEHRDQYANYNGQEDFESMVKVVLQENKVLKQRWDLCNQLMTSFEGSQDFKPENVMQAPAMPQMFMQAPAMPEEPSLFFNQGDFEFFDFLKEKDSIHF